MTLKQWITSLIDSIVSGVALACLTGFVMPHSWPDLKTAFAQLWIVAVGGAVLGFFNHLRQSPITKIVGILASIFLATTLILPIHAGAQTVNTWYPVEKTSWKTLAWDAVTALNDGDPLPDPADAVLTYNIYIKNVNTSVVLMIASGITALQQEIVLPKRARYLIGVEAALLYTGETAPMKSPQSWSDNAAVVQGGATFGLRFQTGPKEPKELR